MTNPFKKFTVLNVLDDGKTFSGVENSTIQVYPKDANLTVDQLDSLENGCLPETGDIETIDLKDLLNQALAANLPAVKGLAKRLK
jgi:hypothetical protein